MHYSFESNSLSCWFASLFKRAKLFMSFLLAKSEEYAAPIHSIDIRISIQVVN
jgi:hypothetical protein